MHVPKLVIVLFLIAFLFFGFSSFQSTEKPKSQTRSERTSQRLAEAANAKAVSKVHRIGDDEVVILDIPSVDKYGHIDMRRCFVWRDDQFHTASMQCPNYDLPIIDPS